MQASRRRSKDCARRHPPSCRFWRTRRSDRSSSSAPKGNVIVYNSPRLGEGRGRDPCPRRRDPPRNQPRPRGDVRPPAAGRADGRTRERPSADPPEAFRSRALFTHRQLIDDDLEVIPTPGHTPGTTSYLWDSGTHRFLFTGDSLWVEYGEWKAVVLGSSDRTASLDSFRLISDLDFDALVPWAAMKGEPSVNVVNHDDARTRIDAVIARVEAGGGY